MFNFLQPHGLQHARPPCPSLIPGVYSNSCPLIRWCHPTISSSVAPFLLLPSILLSIRVFSTGSAFHTRWPKYWSFSLSISPSNEHPGLISFRRLWLDLLAVQGTLKSLLQHHSSKASILQCLVSYYFKTIAFRCVHAYLDLIFISVNWQKSRELSVHSNIVQCVFCMTLLIIASCE